MTSLATSSRAASTPSSSSSVSSISSSLLTFSGWRKLGAVAVEGVGFEAELPAQVVAALDLLDGGLVGEVDGLGDCAGDEGLGGGHHADVALDGDEALAEAAAFVGAVEDGVVFMLEVRCVFDGAVAADGVVGFVDLLLGEAEVLEEVEAGLLPGRLRGC